MHHLHSHVLVLSSALIVAGSAPGAVTTYTAYDAWSSDASNVTTITFGEVPPNTLVTDQYASMGVLFTDSDGNWTTVFDTFLFPEDGHGLDGEQIIELELLGPAFGVAAHFPGGAQFQLYAGETLIYESPWFGVSGVGHFGGLISTVAFDRVVIFDQIDLNDQIALDNLYLSFAPIPAPGVLAALALAGLCPGRRRRR